MKDGLEYESWRMVQNVGLGGLYQDQHTLGPRTATLKKESSNRESDQEYTRKVNWGDTWNDAESG